MEYFAGYLLEKSLAIDNVFVWLMILPPLPFLQPCSVKFCSMGYWALLYYVPFLFLSVHGLFRNSPGFCIFLVPSWSIPALSFLKVMKKTRILKIWPLLKWLRKHIRITSHLDGHNFFVRQNGVLWVTPLFLVLILVEASDVIFAVDSIPAIFAVTTDPFIVLTANLMAILGLRAMFFTGRCCF